MRKLLSFILMPVLLGLLMGLGIIVSNQELRYKLGDQFQSFFLRPTTQVDSYANAVNIAAQAVVNISTRTTINLPRNPLLDDPLFRHFFNTSDIPSQRKMSSALGSGVIINKQGYILTNHHVVKQADEIFVSFYDGRNLRATLIGSDPETDLAVLKISAREDLPIIELGNSQTARVGDVVLAIGNPFNIGQTVTQGIISAMGRHGLGLSVYEDFIQTDAAINPGNSGGALVNTQGQLLGINTAILNQNNDGTSIGIGFAIPADIAFTVMSDIVTAGEAIRGWLGIEARAVTQEIMAAYKVNTAGGVLVTGVYPDGPAEQAGIRPGDVLTHINNQVINSAREGMNLIAQVKPLEAVQLTLSRQGIAFDLTAIAGRRPSQLR